MKLGRKRPPHRAKLALKKYLDCSLLPMPPTFVDYASKAVDALANVYENDVLGDCVIAGGYHCVGVWTGNAGAAPFVATRDQIIADYAAIGGYVPGDPSTDNGCDEQTALRYWSQKGFADGSKIAGFCGVDATDIRETMTAIYLFEDLLLGIELPDEWLRDTYAETWSIAGDPNPANGHCVVVVGYDGRGVQIATWGMIKTITWSALAKYCAPSSGGEMYVLFDRDELEATGKSPAGFDALALLADLALLSS